MTKLLYIDKVKTNQQEFADNVISIARSLGVHPDWLMAAMNFESEMDPTAINPKSGAGGLIQFMPTTAIALGTTVPDLVSKSNIEQLDYVYRYFLPYANQMHRYLDVYLAIFFPYAVGAAKSFVIQTDKLSASQIAKANPIFDINRDGKITVKEVEKIILGRDPELKKKLE
jgi:hypothetical protein